ncbi:HNH endonuclease [Priestia megaterium]|uniref:HNH endonuclease n=1 Tax=Priestia megaterium TaxID=1404 RepID=UPI0025AF7B54|nr:HNH endonuclease [Priestia megaterium]MDN3362207.1 HNH endonuclease [Priestia megaterium]
MHITMDLSEIILYLDLIKRKGNQPLIDELDMMVYHLGNHDQVKTFYNKIKEHEFRPPFAFYLKTLIHFIEDYEECISLKNKILATQRNNRRPFIKLFTHQILLCKSEEEALSILQEARNYGLNLDEKFWVSKFDSLEDIKKKQEKWKYEMENSDAYDNFSNIYEAFVTMKSSYFKDLSEEHLKSIIVEQQSQERNVVTRQINTFMRKTYIKEYAKKIAQGICQLCDKEAPFIDRQGNPFLEVHHINYLSKGGEDEIDNVVALCPNCHRRIHMLEDEEDFKKILRRTSVI